MQQNDTKEIPDGGEEVEYYTTPCDSPEDALLVSDLIALLCKLDPNGKILFQNTVEDSSGDEAAELEPVLTGITGADYKGEKFYTFEMFS